MEQAEKDLKIVQAYLRRMREHLMTKANACAGSPTSGFMYASWSSHMHDAMCNLSGIEHNVIEMGYTLADAARDAELERSDQDGRDQDVPGVDGGA